MYSLFKSLAFKLDPELAHNLSMSTLHRMPGSVAKMFNQDNVLINQDKYSLSIGGIKWKFPIGLAAGLDKDAEAIDFFSRIHFGAVEVGTVTPLGQEGNNRPRLFRLPEQSSLRNRMGFNNSGSEVVLKNVLKSNTHNKVLGINLGKNKVTPAEKAKDDYLSLYKKFCEVADYLVINISSPNTPGLRDLQKVQELEGILNHLNEEREKKPCPLFLKISPDLSLDDLPGVIDLCQQFKLTGLIATNTTIMEELGNGGISGNLLKQKAQGIRNKALSYIREKNYQLELIGVGGVDCFEDLLDFWKNGGKCMQIYTSFIYKGPQLLEEIRGQIDREMNLSNCQRLDEYVQKLHQDNLSPS